MVKEYDRDRIMSYEDRRAETSSQPEDLFVELFVQVFGLEKVQSLTHEYPFVDIYGNSRYIDYAVFGDGVKIAFEIDGMNWHHPDRITVEAFEDGLLRQNCMINNGWKVYRWTDRELIREPERVKSQLQLFLENIADISSIDEYLPKQHGETIILRKHQQEALDSLDEMRRHGKSIGLITHAQGAGKTIVAVTDAKIFNGRTLFIAHRRELVTQAYKAFQTIWPEVETGIMLGNRRDIHTENLVASIQSLTENLNTFKKDQFKYVIIDEAHHAIAESYKKILRYFRPDFILGLTATPERTDGTSVLELFKDVAHRLDLKTAIELGELVPIRCVRVNTNVDISRVRFNQIQYHWKDIEESLIIPSRDALIVKTYIEHVRGKKGVAFCVNVQHGHNLADQFVASGVNARSVSGKLPQKERDSILQEFQYGNIDVLCACDILNEGWDCPEVEVLMMARPTLSKVIYLQQLGRGTRKSEGKESLVVFDFIDNSSRYNQSLNLHRVIGNNKYRSGALVLAPEKMIDAENSMIDNGVKPTNTLNISLWAKDFTEIDIFNWQELRKDMISVPHLEVELNTSEGLIRRSVERQIVTPDHQFDIGSRTYYYFKRESIPAICQLLNINPVVASNIKEKFISYIEEMHMSASYKPVFVLSFFHSADSTGKALIKDVTERFQRFYLERFVSKNFVEANNLVISRIDSLNSDQVQTVMLSNPFEKFERRRFFEYVKSDLANIRLNKHLWMSLSELDKSQIQLICQKSILEYYDRLSK